MKTKEKYEKALKEINDAFYGANLLSNQTRRFDDNLNLLRELVNEHFEEKQETNFEHFKDEIIEDYSQNLSVVKGRPTLCCKTNCNDCDFKINQIECCEIAKEWLRQTHKKLPYKLSKFEFDIIQTYSDCHESCKFSYFKQLIELKDKGYFKNVDKNELIKDILANCEVIK